MRLKKEMALKYGATAPEGLRDWTTNVRATHSPPFPSASVRQWFFGLSFPLQLWGTEGVGGREKWDVSRKWLQWRETRLGFN